MNKKKYLSSTAIAIMLVSLSVATIPTVLAGAHSVYGYVYIDDIATSGVTVKLSFSQTEYETNITDSEGFYIIDFWGHDFEEGEFTVYYSGYWYMPIDNKTLDLGGDDYNEYYINLSVNTSSPPVNNPPNVPSSPSPSDGATGININTDLSWTGGDPDVGDTVAYDVWFGTTNPPPKLVSNQSTTTYDPGTMSYITTHYWQIVSWDNHNASTSGPIWSFTTTSSGGDGDGDGDGDGGGGTSNQNPVANANGPYEGVPDEEIEFDGSGSSDSDGTITNYTWDFGDNITGYEVNPTHAYDNPGIYTVILTVTDDDGATDTNETTAEIIQPNIPPVDPEVDGPQEGKINTTYEFTAVSIDEDNDTIQYIFDWGDGTTNVTEFLPSRTPVTLSHTWYEPGNYTVKITAYDNGTYSDVTEYLVSIEGEKEPTPEEEYDYTWLILLLILIIILLILLWLIKRKKPEEKKQPPKKSGNTSKKTSKKTGKK